jgi:hypothetical protein
MLKNVQTTILENSNDDSVEFELDGSLSQSYKRFERK